MTTRYYFILHEPLRMTKNPKTIQLQYELLWWSAERNEKAMRACSWTDPLHPQDTSQWAANNLWEFGNIVARADKGICRQIVRVVNLWYCTLKSYAPSSDGLNKISIDSRFTYWHALQTVCHTHAPTPSGEGSWQERLPCQLMTVKHIPL